MPADDPWGDTSGTSIGGGGGTGSVGTTGSTGANSGNFWDWAGANAGTLATLGQLGLGAYTASKNPTYHQVPLSPEQSALYQRYLKAFDNPATKYNAGIASDLSKSELGRIGPTLPWNRTSAMSMAYQGLNAPTLSPSGMPQGTSADYYNNIIKNSIANQQKWEGQQTGGSSTPTGPTGGPTSDGSGPTGVSGDPFGHVTSPAGSAYDPFAGLPSGVGGGGSSGGLDAVGGWLSQHPEITKLGIGAIAAAIGSVFGLIPAIATKFAASWLMGKMGGDQQLPVNNVKLPSDALVPAGMPAPIERTPYNVPFADDQASQLAAIWNQQLSSPGGGPDPFSGSSNMGGGGFRKYRP